MIKLTPTQSLYFKHVMTGKRIKQIAKELNVSCNTVTVTFNTICKKFKMKKYEIMNKYWNNELEVEFTDFPKINKKQKTLEEIARIKAMRRLGFTEKEIIEELNDA